MSGDELRLRIRVAVAGAAAGRLFALVVAGSVYDGVEPYESFSSVTALAERVKVELDPTRRATS